jgi:predicted RNA-binding protein with PUA-like domain
MNYWLMKSEPSEYSIDDLKRDKREPWDGIRNYQVRNMMRHEIKKGDLALFYHSNAGKETGVVGTMVIVKEAYPDPTQFDPNSAHPDLKSDPNDPRWVCVDVQYENTLSRLVSLSELKTKKKLTTLPLLRRGNRLSIMPLKKAEFEYILSLAEQ